MDTDKQDKASADITQALKQAVNAAFQQKNTIKNEINRHIAVLNERRRQWHSATDPHSKKLALESYLLLKTCPLRKAYITQYAAAKELFHLRKQELYQATRANLISSH